MGASANVVCAGIAEQHGYGFSFMEFFRYFQAFFFPPKDIHTDFREREGGEGGKKH